MTRAVSYGILYYHGMPSRHPERAVGKEGRSRVFAKELYCGMRLSETSADLRRRNQRKGAKAFSACRYDFVS